MSQRTIVVTGGAGFIGTNLCERLFKHGHRVISIDNYSFGLKENHVYGVEYLEGDTKNIHILLHGIKVDSIFHLGEYSRVEQSFGQIKQVLESNIIGTQAVLEYARNQKTKLIYAGSSTKFSDSGDGRNESPYAWTKAANVDLVRNYGKWFSISYAITYFYNVYGPKERSDSNTGTLIGIFSERFKNNLPLQIRLPGTQRRNFTHVSDIIDGLLLVEENGHGDNYGLGHPDSYSIKEVAEMFNASIEMLPERAGNRMGAMIDTKRTTTELNWVAKFNLPEYIKSLQ